MARTQSESCCSVEELSAHVDGDLPAKRAAEVDAHLDTCQACCLTRDELTSLTSGLTGLADVAPQRDLWPAVARRRAEQPRSGRWRERLRLFWALPVAATVGAAAALLVILLVGRVGEAPDEAATAGPVQALQAVLQAEQTYVTAVDSLQQSLTAGRTAYSPEVQATLDRGLAEIDRTLAGCRQALRQSPDDLKAHQSMLAAYQHKVDFLTELLGDRL